jgi:hypothetical protein
MGQRTGTLHDFFGDTEMSLITDSDWYPFSSFLFGQIIFFARATENLKLTYEEDLVDFYVT